MVLVWFEYILPHVCTFSKVKFIDACVYMHLQVILKSLHVLQRSSRITACINTYFGT